MIQMTHRAANAEDVADYYDKLTAALESIYPSLCDGVIDRDDLPALVPSFLLTVDKASEDGLRAAFWTRKLASGVVAVNFLVNGPE